MLLIFLISVIINLILVSSAISSARNVDNTIVNHWESTELVVSSMTPEIISNLKLITATTPTPTATATAAAIDFVTSSETIIESTKVQGWHCHCWNTTNGFEAELECRCGGEALLRIPQKLHPGMQRLTITSAGIKILKSTGLKNYSDSLQDVILTDLLSFESIEAEAFKNLNQLRTIYISNSPKLQYLSAEVFKDISRTLKSLRIINCGLIRIPDMKYLYSDVILHMVDLEGNLISEIDENSVRVKTEQLILDNNALIFVDKYAFYGSEVAKLSFKGNTKLKTLHKSAFKGIVNIQEIDLSSTALEAMPTEGLQNLEILRIQNTHSLKTIPSVYNFKNLREAWLTHSFHCCAFKFPSRHDPTSHAKRQKHLSQLQQACINNNLMSLNSMEGALGTVPSELSQENNMVNGDDFGETWRRKRSTRKKQIGIGGRHKRWFTESVEMNLSYLQTHKEIKDKTQTLFDNDDNKTLSSFNDLSSITGAPFDNEDSDTLLLYGPNANPPDFGVFHETSADVHPNHFLNAICGNLTQGKIDVKCYPIPDALNPCEDVMGYHWLRGSVWVVVLMAVFGNVAVLIVLFSNRSDVTVPKFLMSNLAFADLCMGFYLLLIASIDAHSMGEYFNFAFDWQYGSGCRAAGFLTVFASHLSVFTLTIITLERWFAITYAIYLNKRIKLKAAANIMIGGWLYSIIMAALPLFGISNYSSTSICLPMEARDSFDIAYLISVLAINGLAFCVIVICYARIYFSLGKETRQAARNASRGEMTVAKKMALLVFTNFACWAPIAFFGLTALAGYPLIDVAKSKILLVFFYPLNSCANPYLYAILTAQYRRDLFLLLSKYGFCTQRAQQYKMTYSMPTNHTFPMPLIGRNSLTGGQRKSSRGQSDEAFV